MNTLIQDIRYALRQLSEAPNFTLTAVLTLALCPAIGLPASILAARAAASQLYGVSPYNPICLFGSLFILMAAAFVASMLPARRAASIEPLFALRTE